MHFNFEWLGRTIKAKHVLGDRSENLETRNFLNQYANCERLTVCNFPCLTAHTPTKIVFQVAVMTLWCPKLIPKPTLTPCSLVTHQPTFKPLTTPTARLLVVVDTTTDQSTSANRQLKPAQLLTRGRGYYQVRPLPDKPLHKRTIVH